MVESEMSLPLRSAEIRALIPHRYPFLLLDAVTAFDAGEWAEGYKMISENEAVFQGHFPDRPIFPGVLIIEALAQLAAVCFAAEKQESDGLGVFAGMDRVKFRRKVLPGDRLDLRIETTRRRGPFVRVEAQAWVDDERVAEGQLSFTFLSE